MIARLQNITLITRTAAVPGSALDIADHQISAVYCGEAPKTPADILYDGQGHYACPGFVDIHLHGGGGIEFMNAKRAEEIHAGCLAHARHGTTTLVPTTYAGNEAQTLSMISLVRQAQKTAASYTIAGVHLEGPFLSPKQNGAQAPGALKKPTPQSWEPLLNAWPEGIKIVGAAVELPGAFDLGDELKRRHILGSIAHSNADYAHCAEALHHGFTDITHIYSGCSMVHRQNGFRYGGVVEAGLLEDGFTVQVIADGCHLPPELLRLIYKNKGADRISLITDALFAAGADYPEGSIFHQANGIKAILEDGVMKMLDRQAFCGSTATMDRLVRNMVHLAGVPIWEAVTMASATPARVIGLTTKGSLLQGFDADICLLDRQFNVVSVMAMGKWLP